MPRVARHVGHIPGWGAAKHPARRDDGSDRAPGRICRPSPSRPSASAGSGPPRCGNRCTCAAAVAAMTRWIFSRIRFTTMHSGPQTSLARFGISWSVPWDTWSSLRSRRPAGPVRQAKDRRPRAVGSPRGGCQRACGRDGLMAGCCYSAGTASETMSMRQPVSLAARRAFCPSLPMASESW